MEPRAQAALWTAEAVALVACLVLPLPGAIALIALFVVASASLYVRGQRWADRFASDGWRWGVGALTGLAALALAVVVVGPALEARTGGIVGWAEHAMVRGRPPLLVAVALIAVASAAATEAVWRGWFLERVRELARAGRAGIAIAVAVTAAAEAAVVLSLGATGWSALGAAVSGVAASTLYLGAGRSLVAPIAARATFEVGVLVLEALRVVN